MDARHISYTANAGGNNQRKKGGMSQERAVGLVLVAEFEFRMCEF